MKHLEVDSPLGPLTLVGTDDAVTGLYFPNHWTRPDRTTFGERDDTAFPEAVRQLKEYFAGQRTTFDVPMQAEGPPPTARSGRRSPRSRTAPPRRTATWPKRSAASLTRSAQRWAATR